MTDNKEILSELINISVQMNALSSKLKNIADRSLVQNKVDQYLMSDGIQKVDDGISDITLCIHNLMKDHTIGLTKNKLSEPFINTTECYHDTLPNHIGKKNISRPINPVIDTIGSIRRRNTDTLIKYST